LIARLLKPRARELPEALRVHSTLKGRPDPGTPISEADFVAFDTELTGLDFKRDSIISIGAVRLKGETILPGKTFYRLVKPESRLKSESVVIHEIRHADLEEAGDIGEALNGFVDFIGDAVLIGHFVYIDLNFVNKALKNLYGITLKSSAVDTGSLHEWLYDNDSSFARHYGGMTLKSDLYSMAKAYGIPIERTHDALHDAYITAQLFQRFLYFLPGCGINTVGELLTVGKP
jgi:DNA polymerase-3 subunit epsilon